jgi:nucleoside 2-deoxyribosyltransferase
MPIYVAGPVVRPAAQQPGWVAACYELIEDFVRFKPQYKTRFPIAEQVLESMDAGDFTKELTRRIQSADNVIAVFLPDDQSVPVECALAVAAGKRVLLLHESSTRIPRILAGLPRVTTAVFGPSTPRRIELFLLS